MKILVTGGTGFVGRCMQATEPPDLEVTYLNRKNYEQMEWAGENYDHIVHLINISPSLVLQHSKNAHILYASSGVVYYSSRAYSEYRENKIRWEQLCSDSRKKVSIARLFTFWDEGAENYKALASFVRKAKAGLPIIIKGTGTSIRSYMSATQLGISMWAILLLGENEIYDVGDDRPITTFEVAREVTRKYNFGGQIIIENNPNADDMPYYMPVNTKSTRQLVDKFCKIYGILIHKLV